jgi:hypothetical protein
LAICDEISSNFVEIWQKFDEIWPKINEISSNLTIHSISGSLGQTPGAPGVHPMTQTHSTRINPQLNSEGVPCMKKFKIPKIRFPARLAQISRPIFPEQGKNSKFCSHGRTDGQTNIWNDPCTTKGGFFACISGGTYAQL